MADTVDSTTTGSFQLNVNTLAGTPRSGEYIEC